MTRSRIHYKSAKMLRDDGKGRGMLIEKRPSRVTDFMNGLLKTVRRASPSSRLRAVVAFVAEEFCSLAVRCQVSTLISTDDLRCCAITLAKVRQDSAQMYIRAAYCLGSISEFWSVFKNTAWFVQFAKTSLAKQHLCVKQT